MKNEDIRTLEIGEIIPTTTWTKVGQVFMSQNGKKAMNRSYISVRCICGNKKVVQVGSICSGKSKRCQDCTKWITRKKN
jgi:hypothetical protein